MTEKQKAEFRRRLKGCGTLRAIFELLLCEEASSGKQLSEAERNELVALGAERANMPMNHAGIIMEAVRILLTAEKKYPTANFR